MEELAGEAERDNGPRGGGPRRTRQGFLHFVTQTRGLLSGATFDVNAPNVPTPMAIEILVVKLRSHASV